MTNHPGRKPGPTLAPVLTSCLPAGMQPASAAVLIDLQQRAGLSDAQMAQLCRAGVQTWRNWTAIPARRAMPPASMELLCLALMVGTVEHRPFVAPGAWCMPFVRREFALLLRAAR